MRCMAQSVSLAKQLFVRIQLLLNGYNAVVFAIADLEFRLAKRLRHNIRQDKERRRCDQLNYFNMYCGECPSVAAG